MINFFTEDIDFSLKEKQKIKNWIKEVIQKEGFKTGIINYIFCSDEYLLNINKEYLDHNYYTDVITFNNSENTIKIEGDIFISIERINDNAKAINTTSKEELLRVIIHGILHLCGYKDKTSDEEKTMRLKEDNYLQIFN